MKLEHQSFLPFSTVFLVTGLTALGACALSLTSVDAFVSNSPTAAGGSRLVLPRSSSSDGSSSLQLSSCRDGYTCFDASPRGRNYRDRQRQHAEEAFRELQRELEDINKNEQKKRAAKFGGPQSYYSPFGTPGVIMGGTPMPIDGDAAKKWIEKAFDVASEFNGDFATTEKERDANEEFLRKSRKWAEQILESTTSTDTDESETTEKGGGDGTTSSSSSPQSTAADKADVSSDKTNEPAIETPNLENTSDEDTFRVAVDLPGVKKDDVDVTVEDDFLVVRGTRYTKNNRQTRNRRFTDAAAGNTDDGEEVPSTTPKTPTREYEKKIAFVESEVEIEDMEASFENGVLVVSAPKKKEEPPPKDEAKRRIPIA